MVNASLRHKRGAETSAPVLKDGQIYLCTDTDKIIKGTASGNKVIGDINRVKDIAVFGATCVFANGTYTLTLNNAPASLPSLFTVRVQMPSAWVDGSTITIGSNIYSVVNASFAVNDVVTINFDGVNKKGFFKSGGGGVTETLPPQADTLTATVGDSVINLAWTIASATALTGFYIVYKSGAVAPTTINDGSKIDITDNTVRATTITGLTNGTQYTASIFPYNSKKQPQTIPKYVSATPSSGIAIKTLAIGSKIKIVDSSNGSTYVYVVADKNKTGYPANSVTLLADTAGLLLSLSLGSTNFSTSSMKTYLNGTLLSRLGALGSNILDTTITQLEGGIKATTTCKIFICSCTELLSNPVGTDEGSSKLAYFNSVAPQLTTYSQFTRSSVANGPYIMQGNGTWGYTTATYSDATLATRPVFNVNDSMLLKPTVNAQGQYELM
jgi:hypothetical protein